MHNAPWLITVNRSKERKLIKQQIMLSVSLISLMRSPSRRSQYLWGSDAFIQLQTNSFSTIAPPSFLKINFKQFHFTNDIRGSGWAERIRDELSSWWTSCISVYWLFGLPGARLQGSGGVFTALKRLLKCFMQIKMKCVVGICKKKKKNHFSQG